MELDLTILKQLSKEHGDSFYLLDSRRFRANYIELLNSFKSFYSKTIIGYSYKTNYTPAFCSIVNELGGCAEVVSEMEYDLAIKIGVDPMRIIVNGPYKTKSALIKYFKNGSLVNLDSGYEIEIIKEISGDLKDFIFRIGIRCNFQITDKYISRFGFNVEGNEFRKSFSELEKLSNVRIEGIHCHFPERILDLYNVRVINMLRIASGLFSSPPKFIDIGGGYFGKMPQFLSSQFKCNIATYEDYARIIAGAFDTFYKNTHENIKPNLIIEPGSAIVADTLKFVTKVLDIKRVGNKYIALTSGSKFNMGAFASTITMPMDVLNDTSFPNKYYDSIDISGFTCIESDYLFTNYNGSIGKNAFLVFSNVGSYSIVFKPPFILPNFPIIEIDQNNNVNIIKRKETTEDVFTTFNFE